MKIVGLCNEKVVGSNPTGGADEFGESDPSPFKFVMETEMGYVLIPIPVREPR